MTLVHQKIYKCTRAVSSSNISDKFHVEQMNMIYDLFIKTDLLTGFWEMQ